MQSLNSLATLEQVVEYLLIWLTSFYHHFQCPRPYIYTRIACLSYTDRQASAEGSFAVSFNAVLE
jgi:hypothetical protein